MAPKSNSIINHKCNNGTKADTERWLPQLEQVLGILYLIRSTSNGDDTVTSTIRCIIQLHICTRLLSDALYVLSTFTNDDASQLKNNTHWNNENQLQRSNSVFYMNF